MGVGSARICTVMIWLELVGIPRVKDTAAYACTASQQPEGDWHNGLMRTHLLSKVAGQSLLVAALQANMRSGGEQQSPDADHE